VEQINQGEGTCPTVQAAFELIGKKWTGLLLKALLEKDLCFAELERAVPSLSSRMLALRMRELEAAAVVLRSVSPNPPVRVSYALTEKGRDLEPILRGLEAWARKWPELAESPGWD
jgi:DNA-binding HxlR family transcriptional regulator